jgi:hypothetical protein
MVGLVAMGVVASRAICTDRHFQRVARAVATARPNSITAMA